MLIYRRAENLISDSLNNNFSIHYDHRNLITDLIQRVILVSGITPADTSYYKTYYDYDESCNRIRKKIYNDENDSLLKDIVYSRDLNGKEMAIYENGNIKQWNIWGMENAGFITGEGDKRYYLKDHLGSVRAVIDDGGSLISAQDYDAWGYQLQDRSYNSEESIYKFTSKERDDENKYDYFGARYYDARVGRWGQTEPLLDKYISYSSYQYSLLNPLKIIDKDGRDGKISITGNQIKIEVDLYFSIGNPDNIKGLTNDQLTEVAKFQLNSEDYYSGNFEINGSNYDVTTKFNLYVESTYGDAVYQKTITAGTNVIENVGEKNTLFENNPHHKGVAVTGGFDLVLASGSEFQPISILVHMNLYIYLELMTRVKMIILLQVIRDLEIDQQVRTLRRYLGIQILILNLKKFKLLGEL